VRAPAPLYFPVAEAVPESAPHFEARVVLYQCLRRELEGRALVGSDQFVYWDPTDPRKRLAPDLVVRRGPPGATLSSWKTWERGAPEVGVEIASGSDGPPKVLAEKLERYRQAGIAEMVWFDAADAARPLRLWDLFDGDLVERELGAPEDHRCDALGLYWCVRRDPALGPLLRLARDAAGTDVVLTPAEVERAAKEAERAAKEAERDARLAAEARVAALEAELAKRR